VLVVHGYFEYGARYAELGDTLAARGIGSTALDLRGHGRSEGARGHVVAFEQYLDDVEAALGTIGKPRFLFGHSLGGLVALLYAARRRPELGGLVLTNPYLERALAVPSWKIHAARLMSRLVPAFSLPSGLDPDLLSHDPERNRAYQTDPLIFQNATARWFVETSRAQDEARAVDALPAPLLLVVGDGDRIARPSASLAFFERLESEKKRVVLPGQYHEVLNEPGRMETLRLIADWIAERRG
jgi:alpha-beta hydrolase superfamily lysophospholipase